MSQNPNYSLLPEHIREGMKLYVEQGIIPGSFLQAVLSNDLAEAFVRADDINAISMHLIAKFLFNEMPSQAWGNRENMLAWSKARQTA